MTAFVFYVSKVVFGSGVLFLYYWLFLRNRGFHQWNRFYLLFAVLLSLTLPLLQFTVWVGDEAPGNAWQMLLSLKSTNQTLEEFVVTAPKTTSPEQWLLAGYALVCFVLAVSLLFSVFRIRQLVRSHRVRPFNKIKFIETDVTGTPFSFFRYIFWNKNISLESVTGQQIFRHELVHAEQNHTLDKLFLQVVLVVFWCNPFFWLIRKELQLIHEFIADQKAVGADDEGGFAAMLLQAAYPNQFSSLLNPFFQTSIKRRIAMLTKKQQLNYAGRVIALPVIALVALTLTVRTQASPVSPFAGGEKTDTIPAKEKVIQSVNVNKAEKTLTLVYTDGTSETLTEKQAIQRKLIKEEAAVKDSKLRTEAEAKPLYILDGKEFTGDLNAIDPATISSVNVLKDKTAIDKYGQKGRRGVVEIISKKKEEGKPVTGTDPVFSATEVSASIDQQDWKRFLEENTGPLINEISKEAPAGTYTVNIRFVVNTDGGLSDFEALNDPGYRMAEKVVAMMRAAPKWKPAVQNGHVVRSYHTQPITFVVAEKKANTSE